MENTIGTFYPASREEWREWLRENHSVQTAVWLIYYKKGSGKPTVSYSDAVDEALCFGWIDSKAKPLDHERFMQFFSRRKPASIWSRVNKAKVESLIDMGRMTDAGMACIDIAKVNGSWSILDDAEALIIPKDLGKAFKGKVAAKKYFVSLSRSDKRNILQWLTLAKKEETRKKRIDEVISSALMKTKPKPFR